MIEYIYFVKCPNCEDEPFTIFDEAKNFALGCLSQKPTITQIEVDRNDFGECTDSCDLGTVWSWEDMMDTEKETTDESALLTKDFLNSLDPENDPEFATIDNSVDFEPVTSEVSAACDELIESSADFDFENDSIEALWVAENLNGGEIVAACWADSEDLAHRLLSRAFRERTGGDLRDCYIREAEADEPDYINNNPGLLTEACKRKPIPEGMTIEELVEAMEENEDTVECAWCEELADKDQCKYEIRFKGYLCPSCIAAARSRGETLTFRENNYWAFLDELDEDAELTEKKTWLVFSGDDPIEVGEVYANTEEEAVAEAERKFPDLNYNDYDGVVQVVPADEDLTEATELHDLSNEYDGGYPAETPEVSDSHLKLCPECGKEMFDTETGICVNCGFN